MLVAGPIERATHLLPQMQHQRRFHYSHAMHGLQQILWGLFKKIVIADNCATYVNMVFEDPSAHSASTLALGAILFSFQLYGDFSGYSDIALGVARLFGFELLRNFAFPYFSRDVAEFYRRWHISLSSWFRDYLYIPLGGNRTSTWGRVRNTLIVFAVSGFWHGANWTFVIWGLLNALFIVPLIITHKSKQYVGVVAMGKWLPSLREAGAMALTFVLICFSRIFFRAESVQQALQFIKGLFTQKWWQVPEDLPLITLALVAGFMVLEWMGRQHEYAIEKVPLQWPPVWRWALYYGIGISIFVFYGKQQEFIYFQF